MIENKVYVTPTQGVKIEVDGPFDVNKLYKTAKEYFKAKRYDITEKKYEQKDKPHGKEILILIENEREISKFMIFKIDFKIFARNVFPKDDIVEGLLDLRITGYIELDYKKLWQPWQFSNYLLKVYNNYIIKRKIERYKEKLYREVIELQDQLRDIVK